MNGVRDFDAERRRRERIAGDEIPTTETADEAPERILIRLEARAQALDDAAILAQSHPLVDVPEKLEAAARTAKANLLEYQAGLVERDGRRAEEAPAVTFGRKLGRELKLSLEPGSGASPAERVDARLADGSEPRRSRR